MRLFLISRDPHNLIYHILADAGQFKAKFEEAQTNNAKLIGESEPAKEEAAAPAAEETKAEEAAPAEPAAEEKKDEAPAAEEKKEETPAA